MGTGLASPILQVDGAMEADHVKYSFVSDYGEEDVAYTLTEIFPGKDINLVCGERLKPRSADHLFTVTFKSNAGNKFSWPEMKGVQEEVIQNLKRIPK